MGSCFQDYGEEGGRTTDAVSVHDPRCSFAEVCTEVLACFHLISQFPLSHLRLVGHKSTKLFCAMEGHVLENGAQSEQEKTKATKTGNHFRERGYVRREWVLWND